MLVVNDDGIKAPGIRALVAALHSAGGFDVRVAAPTRNCSACSHRIAIRSELKAHAFADGSQIGFPKAVPACAVDGSPADAVRLALCVPSLLIGGKVEAGDGATGAGFSV